MRVELSFRKKDFVDIIKKMAIPTKGKQKFHFPIISPMVKDGMLEWIAISDIDVWVRVRYNQSTGLTIPARIHLDANDLLNQLKTFKPNNQVSLAYDTDQDIITLTSDDKTVCTKMIYPKVDKNVFDCYPVPLDNKEVIILRKGMIKTDIYGSLEVKYIKKILKFVDESNKDCSHDFCSNKLYHFVIDENIIKAIVTYKNGTEETIQCRNRTITGKGDLYYTEFLPEVINNLSGIIEFHTVDKGPLWIMEDTQKTKVRYLIPPALRGLYEKEPVEVTIAKKVTT